MRGGVEREREREDGERGRRGWCVRAPVQQVCWSSFSFFQSRQGSGACECVCVRGCVCARRVGSPCGAGGEEREKAPREQEVEVRGRSLSCSPPTLSSFCTVPRRRSLLSGTSRPPDQQQDLLCTRPRNHTRRASPSARARAAASQNTRPRPCAHAHSFFALSPAMDFFLGIRGPTHGFVMLCADTAATQQIITIKHDEDKLVALDGRTVMALSGECYWRERKREKGGARRVFRMDGHVMCVLEEWGRGRGARCRAARNTGTALACSMLIGARALSQPRHSPSLS